MAFGYANAPAYAGGGSVPLSNFGSSGGFNPYLAGGMGMMGAGIGSMMSGWKNPSDSAMGYMDEMPGMISKYLDPYITRGLVPGKTINDIGQDYQQSPGFKFALEQAIQGAGHAAAAGGMAGSPQHEQQNMTLATNLGNQDYNEWLKHALGVYGIGAQTGIAAGEDMASILANKAKLAYEGQNAENEHSGGMWGSLLGGAGTLLGGPIGGAIGSTVGGWF